MKKKHFAERRRRLRKRARTKRTKKRRIVNLTGNQLPPFHPTQKLLCPEWTNTRLQGHSSNDDLKIFPICLHIFCYTVLFNWRILPKILKTLFQNKKPPGNYIEKNKVRSKNSSTLYFVAHFIAGIIMISSICANDTRPGILTIK